MCRPQSALKPMSITSQMAAPQPSPKPNKKARKTSKQNNGTRRRRRPSNASKSDESTNDTACTGSTLPSDQSLDSSFDTNDCHHSPKRKTRRRRSTKCTKLTPKQVEITELTDKEKAQYIALDAEMVGILDKQGREHSALARISLVDWNGETIFDSYVRVTQPIFDYRTSVSGITPENLDENALPPLEARRIVGELIHNRIVVGHGLKNDFKALGLSHPWYLTRDTAKYQPFMKPSPIKGEYVAKKLKTLAYDKLGMVIQQEGEAHDPREDAVAALELYKKHRGKWERVVEWKMERTRVLEEGC